VKAARPEPPRLSLTPTEASASLGCSRSHFDRYVLPQLRIVRSGRLRLIPVRELERFLAERSALTLERDR
jgi:excisionase family DNA binding protein